MRHDEAYSDMSPGEILALRDHLEAQTPGVVQRAPRRARRRHLDAAQEQLVRAILYPPSTRVEVRERAS